MSVAIEWFVRCRGLSPKQDYVWLDARGDRPSWIEPPVNLDPRVFSGGGLLVGLGGFSPDGRAVAFVDGLKSGSRDFANRPISLAVLGIADADAHEHMVAILRRALGPEGGALAPSIVEMRDEVSSGFTVVPGVFELLSAATESKTVDLTVADAERWGQPILLSSFVEDSCRKLLHDGISPGEVLLVSSDILTEEWCRRHRPFRAVSPLIVEPVDYSAPVSAVGEWNPKVRFPRLLLALGVTALLLAIAAFTIL